MSSGIVMKQEIHWISCHERILNPTCCKNAFAFAWATREEMPNASETCLKQTLDEIMKFGGKNLWRVPRCRALATWPQPGLSLQAGKLQEKLIHYIQVEEVF